SLLRKPQARSSQPITSAPPLFTLNGFGVTLYGSRDPRPDGTVIATYFIVFLFFPIFPLAAYRVIRDRRRYYFFSKEPLGALARGYRWVVAAGLAGLVVLGVVNSWLNSPSHRAKAAVAAAIALERKDPDAAARAYKEAIDRFRGQTEEVA